MVDISKTGNGTISLRRLRNVYEAFKWPITEAQLQTIIFNNDKDKDG